MFRQLMRVLFDVWWTRPTSGKTCSRDRVLRERPPVGPSAIVVAMSRECPPIDNVAVDKIRSPNLNAIQKIFPSSRLCCKCGRMRHGSYLEAHLPEWIDPTG